MPSRRCVENALRHHGRQPGETVNFHLTVCLLVGLCWALQIASGAGFGAVSYYYYGRLPEDSRSGRCGAQHQGHVRSRGTCARTAPAVARPTMERDAAQALLARARGAGGNRARRRSFSPMVLLTR